ncbi:sulfur carrier protein ThiS [Ruficoccus amylovorans]|uniref:Sulfur carrier protein ThiS n=1 Tax=Ruficoccus amylovorans TaxID=1804625 RepID=A0A842HE11_9BACT|nr:sulfur carrier protein ThiS [Ruficoccus amylovorans]MBC2593581.1 sulfur carrier protein ThiS [Ruficoccus amylovorans]
MSDKIHITANGKPYVIAAQATLPEFLDTLGLAPERVVVERNREALTPAETLKATLANGDNLEIVRIVAGG